MPFFSIVIACYNSAEVLPGVLDSLVQQSCRDFNVIIQDGNSSDETISVLREYSAGLPELLAESGPDLGIYDAWNRALSRSRERLGQWVLFLGADDRIADADVLSNVRSLLVGIAPHVTFACGSIRPVGRGESGYEVVPDVEGVAPGLALGEMRAPHTAIFHQREVFDGAMFDSGFRVAGDLEFLCRTWRPGAAVRIPITVTLMGRGGISDSLASCYGARREMLDIARRYYGWREICAAFVAVCKGMVLRVVCEVFGVRRGSMILDAMREARGLPRCWVDRC